MWLASLAAFLGHLGVQKETETAENTDVGWVCEDSDGGRLENCWGAAGDHLQPDR